jgi:hypothetical protein
MKVAITSFEMATFLFQFFFLNGHDSLRIKVLRVAGKSLLF